MADFCRQCTRKLFGVDAHDYGNLKPLEPGMGYPVLCEDCGPIYVNDQGECISHTCMNTITYEVDIPRWSSHPTGGIVMHHDTCIDCAPIFKKHVLGRSRDEIRQWLKRHRAKVTPLPP